MSDDAPKSALELAMARLRQKDVDAGVVEHPLTDAQKADIATARQSYAAKLAQAEILYKSGLVALVDPEARQTAELRYRRDVQQINDDRDKKIEKIRQG